MRGAILLTTFLTFALSSALAQERGLMDVKNRFLDGSIDSAKARITPSVSLIDSFEDADAVAKWWKMTAVDSEESADHATDGKKSLKVVFKDKGSANYHRGTPGWGDAKTEALVAWSSQILFNDEARLDVFNAESRNVKLLVTMGKTFTFDLKPGDNVVAMKVADMVDFNYRLTAILPTTKIAIEDDKPATLYLDNFRWVGPGLGENLIKFGQRFDCGSGPDEFVRPFFLRLGSSTAYAKESGFGWEKPSDVEFAYDNSKMISFASSGRRPHDQLIRNMIVRAQGPLLVDLPDGKYRVQWSEGNIFAYPGANLACDYSLAVKVGDKVTPIRKTARDFAERVRYLYGRDRADYLPGEDGWSKYLADQFSPWECDVEVTGGQLKLEFLTDPPGRANLNYIILYPVAKADVIEPEIAALWKERRDRFNTIAFQHATIEMATKMHLPGLHEELVGPAPPHARNQAIAAMPAARDGLVGFRRDAAEEVYPDTVPDAADVTDAIAAFAPAGEIATLPINLYALKDLDGVKAELGEFASADGKKLPAKACDLRFVRYSYRMTGQQSHGDWKYMIVPWFLVQRESVAMRKGMSVRWWLNVDVPEGTPPGAYAAVARISAKGLPAREVKLTLDVLPAKLDPVPKGVEFSTLWNIRQEWAPIPDGGYYGASVRMEPTKAKKLAETLRDAMLARSAAEFKLMKRYGLNRIIDRDEMKEVSLVPIELPAETKAILPMTSMKDVLKDAYVGGGGGGLKRLTVADVEEMKQAGKPPVLFGPPKGWSDIQQEPGLYRFCAGFFLWRLGAAGCLYDPWQTNWGDPYHPFDNHCGEWGSLCVPASENWPTLNPSVVLEGIREGIVDYRYLVTLERLIKEQAAKPAAAEAKQYLDKLRESIQPQGSHYFEGVGNVAGGWDNTWHQKDTCWKGKDYADARRLIAAYIAKLQGPQ